jgi:three-Cys-motif partner protein
LSVYIDREQTEAKHFILRRYLQELAFKVLHNWDITYVDGFSGPWESKTDDFSDTSFMIAIDVLRDAQLQLATRTGRRRRIKCLFVEKDPVAYAQLAKAVGLHHKPDEGFEIETFSGAFEDAVPQIRTAIGSAFPLIFIDPTGWTGYAFPKIREIFASSKCEVLLNFMYGHISRFVTSPDEKTIASLDPILGGPGWYARLDKNMEPGPAVEKLFRETLKQEGGFKYVISTRIDKSTADRPHFFLAYGTKDRAGLKAFRETEYTALRTHAKNRAQAKERKREARTGTPDFFADVEADIQEATVDELVLEQKALTKDQLRNSMVAGSKAKFSDIVDSVLQAFMLRETNVKDICVDLAKEGLIQNTWGPKYRKPQEDSIIERR